MSEKGVDAAVSHRGGPLLLLGGPGSGKTTVLERRYLDLANRDRVEPHRALILCTTRAYASSAKEHLAWKLPHKSMVEVPVYTWHALAYHLVARCYPMLGYREPPVLLTGPEQWGVVRELLAAENKVDWPVWGERLRERGFVDEVADFCLRVQQQLMTDEDLEALARFREDWGEVVGFYLNRYTTFIKEESRLDYAGLLMAAVNLLESEPAVEKSLQSRFPHVLVDDAQEMSLAEIRLLTHFDVSNLVVAADPDSGVETFRGAQPEWVWGFEARFGPHRTVVLDRSHRVGEPAMGLAEGLIALNDPDVAHRPVAASHDTLCESRSYGSLAEEADAVGRDVRALHLIESVPWEEIAILVSQPAYILPALERALERYEVPFQSMSGARPLAAEAPVRAFLDLVRISLRLEGWEKLLPEFLTSPLVGLSYSERRRIERAAWQERRSLADQVEEIDETEEFRRLRDVVSSSAERADECFWQVFEQSAYFRRLVKESNDADLDALVAFSHSIGRFVERRHGRGSIKEYLSEAARAEFGGDRWEPVQRRERKGITISSFHAAKGRQWRHVFVMGCLDAWIPKGKRAQGLFDPFALEAGGAAEREVEAIADDRRTFYVASTRASERTVFTSSPGPSGRGRTTRFLIEMLGTPPEPSAPKELPPLTAGEMRARLRRILAEERPEPDHAAAAIALSRIPRTDPSKWYGRWDWTEGSVPLAAPGEFNTSYSRLSVFDNCGLQYVLQTVLGLDPESTHSMKFGTWIHALIQAVHDGVINDIPTLKKAYREIFDETIFPNKAIAGQFKKDGEMMLKNFWENEFSQKDVITEKSFTISFAGANLRGRIDRIDHKGGSLRLTDYKTAKWAPSRKEAEESLQLAIYFLAARTDEELKALGEPRTARLVFPGSTWSSGKMKELIQSDEQADKVLERLPVLIEKVMSEDFKPSPNADCHFCRMKCLCPLWPEGLEAGK